VVESALAAPETATSPVVEGRATPTGVLLSMLASAIFLAGGGASRAVAAVAHAGIEAHPLVAATKDLVAGIALAVAIAGPVLAAAVVVEIAAGLVARAAMPAQVQALIAPLRTLAVLVVVAVGVERMADALARAMP
jgi:type III secretory pathway component EscT